MTFVRINNLIFNPDRIVYVWQDPKDINKISMVFDTGQTQKFEGAEAADIWRFFDEKSGWKEGDPLGRASD